MLNKVDDLRIHSIMPLISPALLIHELPLTEKAAATITEYRKIASAIVKGADDRLLVVIGPCSIHDVDAAQEYGARLQKLIQKHHNNLCIIMRVYFEKPRTTVGWKGLINDPNLDDSFEINKGLRLARKLLLELNDQGVACGTEFLDMIIPQFISDLIAWGAIGARTTESQVHRELASGLSMPVGFKNGTDGNVQIAIDAVQSARYPHNFLSVTKAGSAAIVRTTGNDACHTILRGSNVGTNYDAQSIEQVCDVLRTQGVLPKVMVDCSHGNSAKDHRNQPLVVRDIAKQMGAGSQNILGIMVESHLVAGKQKLTPGEKLVYGQSITDACIAWDETETLLDELSAAVQAGRKVNKKGILSWLLNK